ncbi:hypothetical protein C0583_00765 [Candidatus Parcubacteria bacterium]|nr:MAG: hypothetical protein C0583_00765 [Candidatus Parcubacteria bacterium]
MILKNNMTKIDISKKALEKIKSSRIKPRAKWKFLLTENLFILLEIVLVLFTALFFAVTINQLIYSDWDFYGYINGNLFYYILQVFPYFWFFFLLLFFVLTYLNFKNLRRSYRYSTYIVLGTFVFVVFSAGYILYTIGYAKKIDLTLIDKSEMYCNHVNKRLNTWNQADKGMIAGRVIENKDNFFIMHDLEGNVWNIVYGDSLLFDREVINEGMPIRLVGGFEEKFKNLEHNILIAKELMQEDYLNIKYFDFDNLINSFCFSDDDCSLSFDFAIQSRCPFDSVCINHTCETVCPIMNLNSSEGCSDVTECDCASYLATDKKDCICENERCLVVVDEVKN